MKPMLAALALLLSGTGCFFFPPNPYSTTSDVDALEASELRLLEMSLGRPWDHPQTEAPQFVDAPLEAWRDSVLATADTPTLNLLHKDTRARIAALETQQDDLLLQSEFNRIDQLRRVYDRIRVEELRLAMIEEQPNRPRRDD